MAKIRLPIEETRLTGLSVVGLKVLQQLLLLHDFILGLVQLDPEETNADSLKRICLIEISNIAALKNSKS